jgi:DNA-binding transcriptional regulator of glucitol operon
VPRVFFTPKWLFRHVLALILMSGCLVCGWWQLDRARVTGDIQNIGYSLEWPAFALAVLFVWIRLMQWELRPPKQAGRLTRPLHPQRRTPDVAPTRTAAAAPAAAKASRSAKTGDTEDERLDRYNAYLAELAEREAAAQERSTQEPATQEGTK